MKLASRAAIVSGGGRGLGERLVKSLHEAGWSVCALGRSRESLERVRADLGGGPDIVVATADVTDREQVEAAVRFATERLGPITLLVNNAGVTEHGPIWEGDPEAWWRVIEVNLRGPFLLSAAVVGSMASRREGRVVNVSSGLGNVASADQSAYSVSKSGLTRLTECLALQLSPFGVSAFAINPGPLGTDMGRELRDRLGQIPGNGKWVSPALTERLLGRIADGDLDHLSGSFIDARWDLDQLARTVGRDGRDALTLRLSGMDG